MSEWAAQVMSRTWSARRGDEEVLEKKAGGKKKKKKSRRGSGAGKIEELGFVRERCEDEEQTGGCEGTALRNIRRVRISSCLGQGPRPI